MSLNIGNWVSGAVKRKYGIYLLVLLGIVTGIFGLFRMNKDEFPEFQICLGLVAGIYPGASAEEVELQLTKPLEEFLFTFQEIRRANCISESYDGICYIFVDLNVSQKKKDEVWSKIKLGLNQQQKLLPAGVVAVGVLDDFSNTSSMLIAMESDDKSYRELQECAEGLCSRLRKLPHLSKASIIGKQTEEIAVLLDREKLSAYGLSPTSLALDYNINSLPAPTASFKTSYVESPVRVKNPLSSEREVGERLVWSDAAGNNVRLKDISTIVRRYKKGTGSITYNGNSCLIIDVVMRPGNNIVAFGEEVDKVIADYSRLMPESVRLSRVSDQPKVVAMSVWSFLRDLLIAMLVVIAVMLLLFPLRSALIASSGVPVCIAIAVAVMFVTKMDLNTVTLAALIVTLGMIVDDSIITMDGYMDKLSRGVRGTRAAAASARELFFPTFIATLAICMMFFPIKILIHGYLGDFVKLFPWVILIALMTSLLYAVTVVPSLEVAFIHPKDDARKAGPLSRGQEAFFGFIQRCYDKALEWCFGHAALTIIGGFLFLGLGGLMFSRLNIQMMPKANRDYFVVEIYMEGGCSIERTKEAADSISALLRADPRVKSVTAFTGISAPRFNATYNPLLPSPRTAQLIVKTGSFEETNALLDEYESRYEHILPDALIHFKQMDYQATNEPVSIQLDGEDREELARAAEDIKAYMYTMSDELKWIHSDTDNYLPEVEVELDPEEAARMGFNRTLLALSLGGSFGGVKLADIYEGSTDVPVNLYSTSVNDDMGYDAIGNQMVAGMIPGSNVPLRQIAAIKPAWSREKLVRINGSPAVRVSADLKSHKSQPAAEKKLKHFIESNILPGLPEGVSLSYTGLSYMNRQVLPDIVHSFIAACLILFLFLAMHFKKISIAVLTMAISSLCLFGAAFGLWIFKLDFSITAVLGLISLIGIIVRNGIILFDYAEELRTEGKTGVFQAAMEAGKRRMRPIFLTSCTTALGVLPMIISADLLWMPMGVVICFGTLLSILLITLIMPVSYWLLFRNKACTQEN